MQWVNYMITLREYWTTYTFENILYSLPWQCVRFILLKPLEHSTCPFAITAYAANRKRKHSFRKSKMISHCRASLSQSIAFIAEGEEERSFRREPYNLQMWASWQEKKMRGPTAGPRGAPEWVYGNGSPSTTFIRQHCHPAECNNNTRRHL